MNANTTTFNDLLWNTNSSSTADTNHRLIDRVRQTIDPNNWPKKQPPASEISPTVKDSDQYRFIDNSLFKWLQDLSKADYVDNAKKDLFFEVRELAALPRCWDGGDAEKIAQESIDSAVDYIKNYQADLFFDAYPDPDGTVGLRADFANGRVLLSFAKDGTIAYLIRKGKKINRGHGEDHHTINKLLQTLI